MPGDHCFCFREGIDCFFLYCLSGYIISTGFSDRWFKSRSLFTWRLEREGIAAILNDFLMVIALWLPVDFCIPALIGGVCAVAAMIALMPHHLVKLH